MSCNSLVLERELYCFRQAVSMLAAIREYLLMYSLFFVSVV